MLQFVSPTRRWVLERVMHRKAALGVDSDAIHQPKTRAMSCRIRGSHQRKRGSRGCPFNKEDKFPPDIELASFDLFPRHSDAWLARSHRLYPCVWESAEFDSLDEP